MVQIMNNEKKDNNIRLLRSWEKIRVQTWVGSLAVVGQRVTTPTDMREWKKNECRWMLMCKLDVHLLFKCILSEDLFLIFIYLL